MSDLFSRDKIDCHDVVFSRVKIQQNVTHGELVNATKKRSLSIIVTAPKISHE